MTESYLKRKLPLDYPVIISKAKYDTEVDQMDICNDLCFQDYVVGTLVANESTCLKNCFYKVVEMQHYMKYEFERIFVSQSKKFHNME